MDRKEITNSQDYKAQGIALDWWRRNGYDIKDGVVDIIDAYADGVIYGWNNPQWIPVEERLPKIGEPVWFFTPSIDEPLKGAYQENGTWWSVEYECKFINGVTHWMEIVPPRKEEKK